MSHYLLLEAKKHCVARILERFPLALGGPSIKPDPQEVKKAWRAVLEDPAFKEIGYA